MTATKVPKLKAAKKKPDKKKAVSKNIKKTSDKKASVKLKTAPKKKAQKTLVRNASSKSRAATKNTNINTRPTRKKIVEKEVKSSRKELLIPSPFRFPVDMDKLAQQTARYGGVFFVLVGAFFTLFYSNFTFSSFGQQLAQVSSTSSIIEQENDECNGISCVLYEKTPAVKFSIQDSSELNDEVSIDVEVRKALAVTLFAYNKTSGQNITLGKMEKVGNEEWEFKLDTTQYSDGEYLFKAFVKNMYGTYEQADSEYREFLNDVVTSKSDAQEDSLPVIGDSEDEIEVVNETANEGENDDEIVESISVQSVEKEDQILQNATVELKSDNPIDGTERLYVYATNAERVKIYGFSSADEKIKFLGYAYKKDIGEWRFSFDTTQFPDGKYKVYALVVNSVANYETDKIDIEIQNEKHVDATQNIVLEKLNVEDKILTETEIVKKTQPDISVEVKVSSPLSSTVPVHIEVESAKFVELYATQKSGGLQKYLGMAIKKDSDVWVYTWDTNKLPNAEYKITAKVRTTYGIYESQSDYVKVENKVFETHTIEQKEKIELLKEVANEVRNEPVPKDASEVLDLLVEERTTEVDAKSEDLRSKSEEKYNQIILDFNNDLDKEFRDLTAAIRSKNTESVTETKKRVELLTKKIQDAALNSDDTGELLELIPKKIQASVDRIEADVEKTNIIIAQRTKKAAEIDSDNDGITDFDEVNLFRTDPYVADTDNDGFIDGAEVLSGFDPIDSRPETAIAFESPKEVGIVREDILVVENITTAATSDEELKSGKPVEAIISGKALPNSFVTLYIFSTPIVVTIKTEADGSWQYRFDKELDEGAHEVYVGVTDNAGKIVAKSNPLAFVKTAEAFNQNDSPVAGSVVTNVPTKAIVSEFAIYLVLSISVVAIGLVLILLGLHIEARPRKEKSFLNEEVPAT